MNLLEIGKLLKEERLRQGVELPAVAKVIRVSTSALEAIEEGNEDALPTPVYIKGFVKNYARFLELDPAVIDSALRDVRFISGNAMWSPSQSLPVTRGSFPAWGVGLVALVLIGLVGGGAALLQTRSTEHIVSDSPSSSLETPSPQPQVDAQAQPVWQPSTPQLQGPAPSTTPPIEPAPLATAASDPSIIEQADQVGDETPAEGPSVREDLSLQKAALDNMRLTLRPGNLRADFEIRNISEELISGLISVFFISKDDRTVPALGNEETPRFTIRNFRPVSTRLHLPPDLNLEDVTRVQFVVTDSDGTDVLVKTYPIDRN